MRYYIIVASKDHVATGVAQAFAQAGHGKKTQLTKLAKGDWIIYYSSRDQYPEGKAYQKFTALGQVTDDKPFQAVLSEGFKPWRRKIDFQPITEVAIRPLLDDLLFIRNRKSWGLHLMAGFLEIEKADFDLIADKMLTPCKA